MEGASAQVPFEALKREARCRKAIVENVQSICTQINGAATGKHTTDVESDESALVTALAAIQQLKEQVRADPALKHNESS